MQAMQCMQEFSTFPSARVGHFWFLHCLCCVR